MMNPTVGRIVYYNNGTKEDPKKNERISKMRKLFLTVLFLMFAVNVWANDIEFKDGFVVISRPTIYQIYTTIGELYDGQSSSWRDKGQVVISAAGSYSLTDWTAFVNRRVNNSPEDPIPGIVLDDETLKIPYHLIGGATLISFYNPKQFRFTIGGESDFIREEVMPILSTILTNLVQGDAYQGGKIRHYFHYWLYKK